jgi:hypothetical protein
MMTEFKVSIADQPAGQAKPNLTAAQKALLDRKVLPLATLVHGDYYAGFLGDTSTIGRWNGQRRRFVAWEHAMGEAKLKAAPHIADAGTGARFAPLAPTKAEDAHHVSDFALETTR